MRHATLFLHRLIVVAVSLCAAMLLVVVPSVSAQNPCFGVDGCDASANQLVPFILIIAGVLIEIGAGVSVLMVVVGGVMMILDAGNENLANRGRMSVIYALIGFAIVLMSQVIVSFVYARAFLVSETDAPHIALMAAAVQIMLHFFNVVFAVIIIVAGFRMVLGRGESGEFEKAKKSVFWAIAGALVINLAHALVQAVFNLGF